MTCSLSSFIKVFHVYIIQYNLYQNQKGGFDDNNMSVTVLFTKYNGHSTDFRGGSAKAKAKAMLTVEKNIYELVGQ